MRSNTCPACGADNTGDPILEAHRHMYSGTHFSKVIGIEYSYNHPERYDGVSEWLYPCCNTRVGRWTGKILKEGESEPRFGGSR